MLSWRGSIMAEFVGCLMLMFGGSASCRIWWDVCLFGFLVWYGGFLFMIVVEVVWLCMCVDGEGVILGCKFVVENFLVVAV